MKITEKELKQIIKEEIKKLSLEEADDTINPIGKGGSSWWEKTGRMRPHYTSHGADYERFEPTYKMTSDHPDHPDYKKPPSKESLMRANCRRLAERSVYDYRFDGMMDRKTGDPDNVEAVYTRCMQLKAFTPGRKPDTAYLDDYFKDESWYKDDRERNSQYWEMYYKLSPAERKYMAEGKPKITICMIEDLVREELEKTMENNKENKDISKIDVEELKAISGELHKASDMHKGQAERIENMLKGLVEEELEAVLKEKKNCGCGQDPCETYGKVNETDDSVVQELFGFGKKKKAREAAALDALQKAAFEYISKFKSGKVGPFLEKNDDPLSSPWVTADGRELQRNVIIPAYQHRDMVHGPRLDDQAHEEMKKHYKAIRDMKEKWEKATGKRADDDNSVIDARKVAKAQAFPGIYLHSHDKPFIKNYLEEAKLNMKITKEELIKIIEEEVTAVVAEKTSPNLEDIQKTLQEVGQFSLEVALYKYLEDNNLNVEEVFEKLKTVPRGIERTKVADELKNELGINLEDGVEVLGYDTLRPEPAPIRPSVFRRTIEDIIINVREDKLLKPDELRELDDQIMKAHEDFKVAFDAKMAQEPDEVDVQYGRVGRNRFGRGSLGS